MAVAAPAPDGGTQAARCTGQRLQGQAAIQPAFLGRRCAVCASAAGAGEDLAAGADLQAFVCSAYDSGQQQDLSRQEDCNLVRMELFDGAVEQQQRALMAAPPQQHVLLQASETFAGKVRASMQTVMGYEDPQKQALCRRVLREAGAGERISTYHRQLLESDENDVAEEDEAWVRALLKWFKKDFFSWVNKHPCEQCGNKKNMESIGMAQPTEQDLHHGGHRVECTRCPLCGHVTRWPRYNDPIKLLETRRGRCGEWANCFTFICRSMGIDARYVLDWTDHVWTEVYLPSRNAFLHADSCENSLDAPFTYERGWNKKLTYIIAFSRYGVQDVIHRYSRQFCDGVLPRRDALPEATLRQVLASVHEQTRDQFNRILAAAHEESLETQQTTAQQLFQQEDLLDPDAIYPFHNVVGFDLTADAAAQRLHNDVQRLRRSAMSTEYESLSEAEQQGRTSGDEVWRQERGEMGSGSDAQPTGSSSSSSSAVEDPGSIEDAGPWDQPSLALLPRGVLVPLTTALSMFGEVDIQIASVLRQEAAVWGPPRSGGLLSCNGFALCNPTHIKMRPATVRPPATPGTPQVVLAHLVAIPVDGLIGPKLQLAVERSVCIPSALSFLWLADDDGTIAEDSHVTDAVQGLRAFLSELDSTLAAAAQSPTGVSFVLLSVVDGKLKERRGRLRRQRRAAARALGRDQQDEEEPSEHRVWHLDKFLARDGRTPHLRGAASGGTGASLSSSTSRAAPPSIPSALAVEVARLRAGLQRLTGAEDDVTVFPRALVTCLNNSHPTVLVHSARRCSRPTFEGEPEEPNQNDGPFFFECRYTLRIPTEAESVIAHAAEWKRVQCGGWVGSAASHLVPTAADAALVGQDESKIGDDSVASAAPNDGYCNGRDDNDDARAVLIAAEVPCALATDATAVVTSPQHGIMLSVADAGPHFPLRPVAGACTFVRCVSLAPQQQQEGEAETEAKDDTSGSNVSPGLVLTYTRSIGGWPNDCAGYNDCNAVLQLVRVWAQHETSVRWIRLRLARVEGFSGDFLNGIAAQYRLDMYDEADGQRSTDKTLVHRYTCCVRLPQHVGSQTDASTARQALDLCPPADGNNSAPCGRLAAVTLRAGAWMDGFVASSAPRPDSVRVGGSGGSACTIRAQHFDDGCCLGFYGGTGGLTDSLGCGFVTGPADTRIMLQEPARVPGAGHLRGAQPEATVVGVRLHSPFQLEGYHPPTGSVFLRGKTDSSPKWWPAFTERLAALTDTECLPESAGAILQSVSTFARLNGVRAPEAIRAALGALVKYLHNMIAHPDQAKFRRVRTSNKFFHSRVARWTTGLALAQTVLSLDLEKSAPFASMGLLRPEPTLPELQARVTLLYILLQAINDVSPPPT